MEWLKKVILRKKKNEASYWGSFASNTVYMYDERKSLHSLLQINTLRIAYFQDQTSSPKQVENQQSFQIYWSIIYTQENDQWQ